MGEGDEDVGEGDRGVGVDRRHTMMASAVFRCHRERGGESPPSSPSSLIFSLDGRRVSPLVHGLHGGGGARAPPRLDLSLCLSLFLRSGILPWHCFLYIWILAFLRRKKGTNRLTGCPHGSGVRPLPRGPLEHRLVLIPLPKIHIYSKKISISFIQFGLRLIWIF